MGVVEYLEFKPDFPLKIHGVNEIKVFCDASFSFHPDGKGHSGFLIWYEGNAIWMSKKQKVVSGSTFESELNCLYFTIGYVQEAYNFVNEIGMKPSVHIYEDNQAVLSVIKNGTGANGTSDE